MTTRTVCARKMSSGKADLFLFFGDGRGGQQSRQQQQTNKERRNIGTPPQTRMRHYTSRDSHIPGGLSMHLIC